MGTSSCQVVFSFENTPGAQWIAPKKSDKIAFKQDILCYVSSLHFSLTFIYLGYNNTLKEKPEWSF